MNKDKTIPKLWDNKVDKGGYTGTAQNLKSEIDSKISKNGDTMTGKLTFENVDSSIINSIDTSKIAGGWAYNTNAWSVNNSKIFECGISGNHLTPKFIYWGNRWNDSMLRLYLDGTVELKANNLQTTAKEVIGAINELYNQKIDKNSNSNLTCGSIRVKSQTLDVLASHNPALRCYDEKGTYLSMIGVDGTATILWNGISEKQLRLNSDGSVHFDAVNLNTTSKDVIGAINEVNGNKLNTTGVL